MTGMPVLVHSLSVFPALVVVTVFQRVHVFFVQFRDGHFTLVIALSPLVGRRADFFGFPHFSFGGRKLIFYVSHFIIAVFKFWYKQKKTRKRRVEKTRETSNEMNCKL